MKQNTYTLLCEKDMGMALITIPKLRSFIDNHSSLIIVDDGTLSEKSIEKLKNIAENIIVVTRKERDEIILNKISKYPNICELRNKFAFAFKLIDIPILSLENFEGRYTYTDTDIIYYKNCEAYFTRLENTHLRTDGIKLSIKLQKLLLKYNWKIPYKFNAGYLSFDTKDYDLDFIAGFLKNPDIHNVPWLVEQTCWGLLFSRAGKSFYPNEEEFLCREDLENPTQKANAIHLIGDLKKNLSAWSNYILENQNISNPCFKLSRNVTLLDWGIKSIKRLTKI